MKHRTAITTLPLSPDEERGIRMLKYGIAMGVRLACVIACFFTPGWWILVPAVGAVVLPYVAVVIANVQRTAPGAVERPGGLVRHDDGRWFTADQQEQQRQQGPQGQQGASGEGDRS
ncbi:DUF3099 domain-containing protein [Ruicaihuangia caeni]|uniref:DUF3099 domain-containing protein n=1 Tax=Ruicaihuangia caeni TaxID=3042517 RepID=A0AAW6T2V8_9MICO|nr:DUF3099 domain-containing protein [Klugiella sp. YN-L-19]MDI2098150.1 DUF3099 domain-containing protein [Klugiella sp. YN-L-19]